MRLCISAHRVRPARSTIRGPPAPTNIGGFGCWTQRGRIHSYGACFAGVPYSGHVLLASILRDGDKLLAIIAAPSRDDETVLSGVEVIPA